MRYFLRLAYFGKPFHGWQIQPNAPSVQQTLTRSLATIVQEEVSVSGAGRTDTGVHAREMYAHFDLSEPLEDRPLIINRLNKMLGPAIAVYELFPVPENAHARFDALRRDYEYHISRIKNPFIQDLSAQYTYPLDGAKMQTASGLLLGEKDFRSFCKSRAQIDHGICRVERAEWQLNADLWVFKISANRFLRNMVRAIVGSLLEVGRGRMSIQAFEEMIKAKDRRLAGESVAPQGLYLTGIEYPKEILDGRFS